MRAEDRTNRNQEHHIQQVRHRKNIENKVAVIYEGILRKNQESLQDSEEFQQCSNYKVAEENQEEVLNSVHLLK